MNDKTNCFSGNDSPGRDARDRGACKEWEEAILLHVDRELDPEEDRPEEERVTLAALTAHLDECEACANALARLEEQNRLLNKLWPEERTARPEPITVDTLIKRSRNQPIQKQEVESRKIESIPLIPKHRKWFAAAGVAAAVLLLLWGFMKSVPQKSDHELEPEDHLVKTDVEPVEKLPSLKEDAIEAFAFPPEEERLAAHRELKGILLELASASDMTLRTEFEAQTRSLDERDWQVGHMLRTVIKRESGPALTTALRLARMNPDLQRLPGMVSALKQRLNDGCEPEPVLELLAAIDDAKARDSLGRALLDPHLREKALPLLVASNDTRATRWISDALLKGRGLDDPESAPFVNGCVRALSISGEEGIDLLVQAWDRSEQPKSWIDVLAEASPDSLRDCEALFASLESTPLYPFWFAAYWDRQRMFRSQLVHRLDRMRGSRFQAGLRMAAHLRLEGVLPYLVKQGDTFVHDEAPWLASRVGGGRSIEKLVEMYKAPVSIRMRKRVCSALSFVFDLYPEETGDTLDEALLVMEDDDRLLLLDMLAEAGDAPACATLSWLLEKKPSLSSAASLALARIGSRDALDTLMTLLVEGRLVSEARLAATAAAYHLGGSTVLRRIDIATSEAAGGGSIDRRSSPIEEPLSSRGSITQARFKRLKGYISSSRVHKKIDIEKEAK